MLHDRLSDAAVYVITLNWNRCVETLSFAVGDVTEVMQTHDVLVEESAEEFFYALSRQPWELAVVALSIPDERPHFSSRWSKIVAHYICSTIKAFYALPSRS
jgi:hypothetical protein